MSRACTKCGTVVAEAAYCPFCSEPTIEHIPVPEKRDAMTIRTQFEQRNRLTTTISATSFLMVQAGAFMFLTISQYIGRAYPSFFPFMVAAMFLFLMVGVITIVYGRTYAFPCPRCEKNIDLNAIGQSIRYCPFCGMDLDVHIDTESHEPAEPLKKEWGQNGSTNIQLSLGKQKANTDIQFPPGKVEKGTAT